MVDGLDAGQFGKIRDGVCWRPAPGRSMETNPSNPPVVYACSGCSDAGGLVDRIARRLSVEGRAWMSCLAGIGGRVQPLMRTAMDAESILVIDGCPLNCARHTLRGAGITDFDRLALRDLGLRKRSCPMTDRRVALGVAAAVEIVGRKPASAVTIPEGNTP
jgi:uncharacterized metal-binding protein